MSTSNPPLQLRGSNPGQLDDTQPPRLLRDPASKLHFASFDPFTALQEDGAERLRNLSLSERLYRPKRVVVEITPAGSFWRFVPRATRDDGLKNEEHWPRLVDVCGTIYDCSQDQWDIYMLDPAYTCVYKPRPDVCLIRPNPNYTKSTRSESSTSKRSLSPVTPNGDCFPSHVRKKQRKEPVKEEDEVEQLLSSESPKWRPKPSQRARSKSRQSVDKKPPPRIFTQPPLESVQELQDIDMEDLVYIPTPNNSQSRAEKQDVDPDEVYSPTTLRPNKRMRTESLTPKRPRHCSKMREERGRQRARQKKEWNEKARKAREDAFIQELFNLPSSRSQSQPQSEPEVISDDSSDDEGGIDPIEVERRKIEESRRKIAELEKDRPLWETARKERERREQEEERERQTAKKARERKAEGERREREYRERMAKEAEERQKREQEERQRQEKERKHTQNRARWTRGHWTIQRALERYRFLCEQFDNAKFSSEDPLTFDDIPWPVLHCTFSVEDIEWSSVENFFASVKPHMRIQDYKAFVEKSHRRFHPDRWRARGLLRSMQDDDERGFIEVAANTVAQALTPLWHDTKGN
ncbi:hypothetical protein BJ322DRAFT_1103221 [Thelephora terrestris]|uniref:Uncharacterized protein n=1 Tax=Thelephora terrestris TaxID=56493 RepID=A0A9P6LBU7_9AGAM|nr:hypothetical protein BJ322DRAFT_1103221 [Thelephora terrestris]